LARCFQFHAIPVHEKHLRSSLGPETRFAAKMFPLELSSRPSSTPVRRRGIIGSESHFAALIEGARSSSRATRMPEVGGVGDERLSSRYPSGVEHRDPRAGDTERGNPLEPKGMAIRFPFDQYHHPPPSALRRGGARFGSRFPPEAVIINSDPKTGRQLLGAHPEIWKWNRNDRRGGRNHLSPSML
jgi:hypothetical protein